MVKIEDQQPLLVQHFTKLLEDQQLIHAYLFVGPTGSGKRELALWIAAGLFCQNRQNGRPCKNCDECQRIFSGNHPDVIDLVPDGASIKVEQTRFLKKEFSSSGVEGRQKVIIIEQAEKMTTSAANSLLKFIEEPSGQVTAFLLTSNLQRLLPTIISRCQLFKMQLPSQKQLVINFEQARIKTAQAKLLAGLTVDLQTAIEMATAGKVFEICQALEQWYGKILENDWLAFVDVQAQILPLLDSKKDQELLLQLLELLSKDLLNLSAGMKPNYFNQLPEKLMTKIKNYSLKQQLAAVELLLDQQRLYQENINFQNSLEALTLRLFKCYDGL
jgi:DNA polymerase-3 subunit delta'